MEGQQVISSNTVEDFETVAANVRTKIETYFSQLLGIIRKRQTDLISELNEILSRYRQQRMRLMDKVKELEEIKKYHEESSSATIKHLQNDIMNGINSEVTELKEQANSMSVEFEWSQKYARNASKIGKLTETLSNDVTMPGADCSLFIFSKRLYEGLIYRTDVGPIPRDSYREEQLSSEFAKSPNWRVAIEGCYWCGKPTRANQYTYVCDKKCYSLLHEWCRKKLYEFCGDSLCMYPSCEKPAVETANCCSESHQQILEASYRSIKKGQDTNLGKGPYWYRKKEIITNKKITQFFPPADLSQQQPQQPQQQSFILSSTSIISPNKTTSHSIPFGSQPVRAVGIPTKRIDILGPK